MDLLNLGCGSTLHPDWVNVDIAPSGPDVLRHDLRKPLPFRDESFDGVYHSHLLEHLEPQAGERLLRECRRVLRPGGVLRVVVPDLEAIAREYVGALDRFRSGDRTAAADHRWMSLEMFDQMVRSRTGGEMAAWIGDRQIPNGAFVRARVGEDLFNSIAHEYEPPTIVQRISSLSAARFFEVLRLRVAAIAVRLIAGSSAQRAFREAEFRNSGEIHRWMYDEISLRQLLDHCGFGAVVRCEPTESRISSFATYELDSTDGRTRKPDSLYVEALRPVPGP